MPRRLLILSQVYVPDPAAVGQHLHDVAAAMAERGWDVTVYTSARGYADPSAKYPARETKDGVSIRRIPFGSLGKRSIAVRLIGGTIFLAQAVLRSLVHRRPDALLVSTSPPTAPLAGVWLRVLRRVPTVFWAMDINPDQMIAVGKTTETSKPAKLFNSMIRSILKRADAVIALDRYMLERLERKTPLGDRGHVIPAWAHEAHLAPLDHAQNPFRAAHDLQDRFVLMYAGNISPVHPVHTVLEAMRRLQDQPRLLALFIGGGQGKPEIERYVETHGLQNVRLMPFLPLEAIKHSLPAADVHLVAMGEAMVGIVHPCKVYGVMAVARPALVLGPKASHLGSLMQEHQLGWQVEHGDVDAAEAALRAMLAASQEQLAAMGQRAHTLGRDQYAQPVSCGRVCDLLESVANGRG